MSRVYIYVVDRDFGFAPNPYHGICSLATCKPAIRNTAKIDDWIFGVGGLKLRATGKCIYAMKVTEKISYNDYWLNPTYNDKKPVRNGSKKMVVGDNIYFFDEKCGLWSQAHSHHSFPDGSINEYNLNRDTKSKNVLLSKHFFYFGNSAPEIPQQILNDLSYKNKVGHRVYEIDEASKLVQWVTNDYSECLNLVMSDPYNFDISAAHYSVKNNKITP